MRGRHALSSVVGSVLAMADSDRDDGLFDRWNLDESFIAGAATHEQSAAERAERMGRIDAEYRLIQQRHATERLGPRRRKTGWVYRLGLVVGLFALGAIGLTQIRNGSGRSPTLLTGARTSRDAILPDGTIVRFPPPPAGLSATPLGRPPAVATAPSGSFVFAATQTGSGRPVTYDPCRPIHIVVNSRAAPEGGEALLTDAVSAVSAATGLRLIIDGATDETPESNRSPVQDARYGNRWAPVLVAWSDPGERSELGGDVAGLGGSQSVSSPSGDHAYVTGLVALDGPQFAEILAQPENGRAEAVGVIEHELAHMVGLGHVSDPTQLMDARSHRGITTFQAGDRAGLAQLGTGPCQPDL